MTFSELILSPQTDAPPYLIFIWVYFKLGVQRFPADTSTPVIDRLAKNGL